MDSGTLIEITAYWKLIKRGCWVLYPCRLHNKNLTVYQNNNSGQKKYRPVPLQILLLPTKLDHNLRFKRHDESVLVCDRNLNKKKNTHPSILDIDNVGPNPTDNVCTDILFKILFNFIFTEFVTDLAISPGHQCYQSLLS